MQTAYWDTQSRVFGAVERGGQVRAEVVPNSRGYDVREQGARVRAARVDDLHGRVARLQQARPTSTGTSRIKHSARIYVDGDVHTQTIEGFWSLVKNGIRGTYHSVSKKWLQGYLNEYAWRYNHRDDRRGDVPAAPEARMR